LLVALRLWRDRVVGCFFGSVPCVFEPVAGSRRRLLFWFGSLCL
jgi:hypothetical protein